MPHNYVKQSEPGAAESDAETAILNIIERSTYFGLADLGFGCPELGVFSLSEIAAVRLPFGLFIERDTGFTTAHPLSVWANTARQAGSIVAAEQILTRTARPSGNELPPRGG
jgi:hypothetical protein